MAESKINKLLFITQKIHQDDDDLAFVILWVKEFIRQGMEVEVVCLEKGKFDDSFPVYSLGKEKGFGLIRRTWNFLRLIFTLKYDAVFVHMNPEYFTLGGWHWFLRGIPSYLWFTHYTNHIHVKLAAFYSKRMFAATKQSLPQYNDSPKKIVTGHGIDTQFWLSQAGEMKTGDINEHKLLTVHRICRSKRLEIGVKSLKYLPSDFTLTVYGRQVEKDYWAEIEKIVDEENLQDRFFYKGPVPMASLKNIYPHYRLMVNMASETIDKTMLEAMIFGIYPVTTKNNSQAIGLPEYPEDDKPETIAKFILNESWKKYDGAFLANIVKERHSLSALVGKMSAYIKKGE